MLEFKRVPSHYIRRSDTSISGTPQRINNKLGIVLCFDGKVVRIPDWRSLVACALANKTCQQPHPAPYVDAAELFDRLTLGKRADEQKRVFDQLVKVDPLVIDDWLLHWPTAEQMRQLRNRAIPSWENDKG
jgi:hypothetical protein